MNQARSTGRVVLVGAGPGDPGLITRRGAHEIRRAHVVVHDRLAAPELLSLARPGALLIEAGKAPGRHALSQDQINATLIEHARLGRRVVRLKGGDPFVFGRGSEELHACREASVPCTVVPGVSSALAAPLSVGVAVTQRGVSRSVAIFSPAVGEGEPLRDDELRGIASLGTAVMLMGRAQLAQTVDRLIAAGLDPATPAAIIADATLPTQRHVAGTVATIAGLADAAGLRAPAVVVIGPSAAWAETVRGRKGPLAGRTVVVTRPVRAARTVARLLRRRGASVLSVPLIDIVPIDADIAATLDKPLSAYGWIVLTSLHGALGLALALDRAGLDARALAHSRFAAVGPKTARQLRDSLGIHADLIPAEHRAAALVRELAHAITPGQRVLFPCGTLALDELPDGLARAGITVDRLRVYHTIERPVPDSARRRVELGADAILLHSPTAARSLAGSGIDLGDALVGAIGPTTAEAAERAGLRVAFTARTYSDEGLVESLELALGPCTLGLRGEAGV
jgi:uroporphyrinogen III methyltransferase/synthase